MQDISTRYQARRALTILAAVCAVAFTLVACGNADTGQVSMKSDFGAKLSFNVLTGQGVLTLASGTSGRVFVRSYKTAAGFRGFCVRPQERIGALTDRTAFGMGNWLTNEVDWGRRKAPLLETDEHMLGLSWSVDDGSSDAETPPDVLAKQKDLDTCQLLASTLGVQPQFLTAPPVAPSRSASR